MENEKKKLKTHVLIVSRYFPATHKRKGNPTYFVERILLKQGCPDCEETQDLTGKNISKCNSCQRWIYGHGEIHTIRANYELWAKRIKEVQEGKAILSIRYWSGSPYNYKKDGSKPIEFLRLAKDSGVGIQKLFINPVYQFSIDDSALLFGLSEIELPKNDGLSVEDFKEWFKLYDPKPMAIIHFTSFRY